MAIILSGTEVLQVLPIQSNGQPAATTEQVTTAQIAALASTESAPFIVTPITTVGNGTLTAAGLVGGEILRSGPTAAFSDATDSAANIIAALPGSVVGSSFNILIKNSTAFTQTITAGAGVTLPSTVITPAFAVNNYVATVSTASTITLVHIDTTAISVGANSTAPSVGTVSTVGAGTLTAAVFVGGLISRTGSQSGTAFTDTTDTAAAIVAACANLVNKIGTSMLVEYANNTNAVATVTGGTGVTVSGVSVIPANTISQFLVTYTAAATLTMTGLGVTQSISTQVTLAGSTSGQAAIQANAIAGNTVATLPAFTDTLGSIQVARCTTTTTYVSTTTLSPVTGMTLSLQAAGAYAVRGQLIVSGANAGGLIAELVGTGGLSLTSANLNGLTYSGTTIQANTNVSALAADFVNFSNTCTLITFDGSLVVNAAGTLGLSAAQHTSSATTSSVFAGSYLQVTRTSN